MPSRPGTGSLLHWTQFPPDYRDGLEQDSTDVAGKVPGSSSGASGSPRHPGKEPCQHVCMKTSVEGYPHRVPAGSCGQEAGILSNLVPKARVQVGWMGLSGQCRQGSGAFVHRACISRTERLPVSWRNPRTSWLLGAGRDGKWPSLADRRAACLCSASWMVGAGQAEYTQP